MGSTSLALHAAGLIILYSLYGVLQERIMKGRYGPEQEKFTSASILVLCNRTFSMCVGVSIVLAKSCSREPSNKTLFERIKPASPIYAYAAVAVLNFLATFCQYEALKYVGFTTQALAKTIKMVPVLVIGTLIYKKTHKARQWVAAGVVLLGCALYLTSRPDPRATAAETHSLFDGICGTLLLLGYLGFDGLTSTTQEKVFGKNPNPGSPFGDDSPVLDQMVWVNLSASMISVVGCLVAFPETMHSISLILTNPSLWLDILLLSGTAALGLIVLLNTIAAFGALTSSTIMTVRQFLSILLNAGLFGHITSVGLQGWLGVMYVASGIWIKMDRRFDEKKPKGVALPESDAAEKGSLLADMSPLERTEKQVGDDLEADLPLTPSKPPPRTTGSYVRQYGPPMIVPVLLAVLCAQLLPVFFPSGGSTTDVATVDAAALVADAEAMQGDQYIEEDMTSDDDGVVLEAGLWGNQLHDAVSPQCAQTPVNTTFYPDPIIATALATFPRSGNSYIRGLVERASSYRTSSVYCDRRLLESFQGECSRDPFLRKTHYPVVQVRASNINTPLHYTQFGRQVHLVRNPIDAIYSYYQFRTMRSHTDRTEIVLGETEARSVLELARRWVRHADYWEKAPILAHQLRYEDLRSNPLPNLMSLLSFLLPADKLPSLEHLACVIERNEAAEAYHSRKVASFDGWNKYTPELRSQILDIVKEKFCRYGYAEMLEAAISEKAVDCSTLSANMAR